MPDGRLLLTIKDAPFDAPILARFASDGTLKMLAYLVLETIRCRLPSLVSKNRKIFCIHACFMNLRKSAGRQRNEGNFWSRHTLHSF